MIKDPGCTRARRVTGRRSGRSLQGGSNRQSKAGRLIRNERERGKAGVNSCAQVEGKRWGEGRACDSAISRSSGDRESPSSECHALSPVGVEERESRIRAPSPAAAAAAAGSEQARADRRRQQRDRGREHHTPESPRDMQPDSLARRLPCLLVLQPFSERRRQQDHRRKAHHTWQQA